MMAPPPGRWLDEGAARRALVRARTDARALAEEVERRMAERLVYVRHEPKRILEVLPQPRVDGSPLAKRYRDADITAAAFAPPCRHVVGAARGWLDRVRTALGGARRSAFVARGDALPIATASVGLVWSNLALAWAEEPRTWLAEWHRILEVGGLLMFTSYGPDTLKELRAAFASDALPHVHRFVDMHDIGDALVACGFADPVVDMEMLTLTYADFDALVAELRSTGQTNALVARRRGLTGRGVWRAARERYRGFAPDGRLPATFEILYGHAWKAAPRITQDGRSIIKVDALRGSRKPG